MNCIIYANCVGCLGMARLFSSHPSFKSIKFYHNYIVDEYPSDEELSICNLFIFQYSSKESVEKYTCKLHETCKQVSFPYIYDDGTFSIHMGTGGFTPIDKLVKKNYTLDEILKMYDDGTIDFELESRREKSIQILKEKEKVCTIQISDFIELNRIKPIFFTHNHPTMILLIELCNRICIYLNICTFISLPFGWLSGIHLDSVGFCHHPWDKIESTNKKSILNLDRYSLKNQVTCLHGEHEKDFYIVSDELTKMSITKHVLENHISSPSFSNLQIA